MVLSKKRALLATFSAVFFGIVLWYFSFPTTGIKHNFQPLLVYGSQVFSVAGYTLFSLSFVFSVRHKVLDRLFGGLDKLYHLHHSTGKLAFFVLLIHPLLLALRWIPENNEKALTYFLPLHRKPEIDLGSWSLLGLTLLILLTIVIKLPYDRWKVTHKFMSLFYVLGIMHVFYIDSFFEQNTLLAVYLLLLSVLGVLAFLYMSIFYGILSKKYHFEVKEIIRHSSRVMEISLVPQDTTLDFIPGQFCFFRFKQKGISRESHPYTICSTSSNSSIEILVKDLGDYTAKLHNLLKAGTPAILDGPYGCFNYKQGSEKQIWIAGGVGIAPFISWAADLNSTENIDLEIDLYYCFKNKNDGLFHGEFQKLEEKYKNFRIHRICSEESGHLKASDIHQPEKKSIFICGPKNLRQTLVKDFRTLGTPGKNIYFEDFDFS